MSSYYGVARGHIPGVYDTWVEADRQVHGFKGAKYRKFTTAEEALAFCQTPEDFARVSRPQLQPEIAVSTETPHATLFTDGGSNRLTRASVPGESHAWGSVVWGDGSDAVHPANPAADGLDIQYRALAKCVRHIIVAKSDDVKTQNNNYAELLALLYALRLATLPNSTVKRICTDSALLINYWTLNRVAKNTRMAMATPKSNAILEATRLRSIFEMGGGELIKISGSVNPADLGFH